jgi:hypothetical protein
MTTKATIAKWSPNRDYWQVARQETDRGVALFEVLDFEIHDPPRPYKFAWAAYVVRPEGSERNEPDRSVTPVLAEWRDRTWRLMGGWDYTPDPEQEYVFYEVARAALAMMR